MSQASEFEVSERAAECWNRSAAAWIAFVEGGDANRSFLLDPLMLELCRITEGDLVLDIGCGEGRFARMLADRGARAIGVDPTVDLLSHAVGRSDGSYARAKAESLPFEEGTFDLAVSYVVLIDIAGYREAVREMSRVLKSEGRAIISNCTPLTTTTFGWHRSESGERLHWPVDRYFDEVPMRTSWRGIEVLNWHRPMESYMSAFLDAGLTLTKYLEPRPDAFAVLEAPVLADALRIPYFHVMEWQKPKTSQKK